MFLELKFPAPKDTIAMLEAEYHKIETAIEVSTDASKVRLERKLLEKIEKEVALWRDKKLTAKNGRISIAITGHDDFYDVGLFYDKACHLQSVLERQVKLEHTAMRLAYFKIRKNENPKILIIFSWREVLWEEDTDGLFF